MYSIYVYRTAVSHCKMQINFGVIGNHFGKVIRKTANHFGRVNHKTVNNF